ncbi:UxaA family hydrolase [Tissierella sp. Yu-01]|uniref:UxaA family hydrolase n=1 Tax=Tissierella sp. Yu-01 TaxID=3035694 RepID=UPI00240E2F56|nr:UxaA family hydrolase [Tissierella sp. Yu-01]WFA08577.1 UxaA family hydrolase [Tissierella sp. Yu-01]
MNSFNGYPRPDGTVGIRNYILVASTVQCANNVAIRIAEKTNAVPVVHDFGCMEFEENSNRTELGLIKACENPNVYGVILVGLGCEQIDINTLYNHVKTLNKPVSKVLIQEEGGPKQAIAKGVEYVNKFEEDAKHEKRNTFGMDKLVVGVQCGGSDWTTALAGNTVIGAMTDLIVKHGGSVLMSEVVGFPGSEHVVANRAVSKKVGVEILDMVTELREDYIKQYGQTIEEVNPTPGNKAGGITTLVEKSMGNIKKMGSVPVQGIIQVGEKIPHPGLWVLDCRAQGPDSFVTTAFAMAGAQITAFSTGRGSPLGNAVMPLVKITGNPESFKSLNGIMDFNAGRAILGEDINKVGEDLYEKIIEVASGSKTKSEDNLNFDYTIPRDIR